MMGGPVTRLRQVDDGTTGRRIDPGLGRAECIVDAYGHTIAWRLWMRSEEGDWRPISCWHPTGHAARRSG